MSVKFTGFSGLQTAPQHALLINKDTWCISFFFRLLDGSSTDSAILDSTYLVFCDPAYTQATSLTLGPDTQRPGLVIQPPSSPQKMLQFMTMKSYDPSLVGIYAGCLAGGEWAQAWSQELAAFKWHHVLLYVIPAILVDSGNPHAGYNQSFFLFFDGVPASTLDQDVGVDHLQLEYVGYPTPTGGISAIDPYHPADSTKNSDFSLRLGNINTNLKWPGSGPNPVPAGQVTFDLEHVALWHNFTPSSADIVALRDQTKTPAQVGTGLQVWWTLQGAANTNVTGGLPGLVNQANSGTYDLAIV